MDLDFFDGTESLSQGGFESGIGDAINNTLMMIERQHRDNMMLQPILTFTKQAAIGTFIAALYASPRGGGGR